LWDEPDLPERIRNAEEYLGTAPEGRRESLATSMAAGKPEYVVRVPHPTVVPLFAALATGGIFVGILSSVYEISYAGVVALLLILCAWWWQPLPEKDTKDAGRGLWLPIELGNRRSVGWFGTAMFIFVDASVFASLVYSYFYLWTAADIWPPPGFNLVADSTTTTGAALIVLVLAAAIATSQGVQRGRRLLSFAGLAATAILSVAILYTEVLLFQSLPFSFRADAYGAVVVALVTYHALHVAVALVASLFALARISRVGVSADRSLAVRVTSLLTGYMAIQGAIAFSVVYFFPT